VSAQLRLPFAGERSSTPSPEYLNCAGHMVPLHYVRHTRARRYLLRVTPDGSVRITLPRWGRKADARRFAESQRAWIEKQRASRLLVSATAAARLEPGAPVLLGGERHVVAFESTGVRTRVQVGDVDETGPGGMGLRVLLVRALRRAARRVLVPRLLALAAEHGLAVAAVSIRDQRTRWGSCSTTGRISLNWRLVQVPPPVADYVLLHELMHLRVPNHSRRFWNEVAAVCPGYQDARRWLREHAGQLL
jgi:predicted metal-dependent hydrolase